MKTFKLFSMAALALVMAACSSEDSALETATPAKPGLIPFSATVAPLSGATTRTIYTPGTDGESKPIINVAWKKGDQIFIARLTPDLGTAGTVTVGKPNGDGSAPLSGNISGADGNTIEAYYPVSAYNNWGDFTEKYKAQDGTLSGIQDNLDYRKGTGEISVIDGKATLATALQMESQIAIWKLTLQNTSGTNLNATKVTIKIGSEIIAATKDISATSEVHMAVPFNTSATFSDLTIEATTADGTYTYAAPSAVNLSHSKYYESTVKMAKPLTLTGPAVGQVIGSDGKNYAANATLPTGVTKVAMIAYVSGSNGLAIALADEGEMNWATAVTTAAAHTPAFIGGTWKLPTNDEWNQMFSANGNIAGSYTGLNTAITNAGGVVLQDGGNWYWSITEHSDSKACYVDLRDNAATFGAFIKVGDDSNFSVRACLAFGPARGHALASSAVGEIVGSDGLAYYASDKDNLPSGVTAVAMVAYKSETAGESLAIQLNGSSSKMGWSAACSYSSYPSIAGNPGTWRLPSKADWQNMFVGCAKDGDDSDASDNKLDPIAGFKEKIGATGITWHSNSYWSSTDSGSNAWLVLVNLYSSFAEAAFVKYDTSDLNLVLGCLAF